MSQPSRPWVAAPLRAAILDGGPPNSHMAGQAVTVLPEGYSIMASQEILDRLWGLMQDNVADASQSPVYLAFPELAKRAEQEAADFIALPPPTDEQELTARRKTATRMIQSWHDESDQRCSGQ